MRFFKGLSRLSEQASRRIGDAVSWLLLAVAGAGVAVLLLRHLLGSGEVGLPPAYLWCSGLVVLAGGGMALKRESENAFLSGLLSRRAEAGLLIAGGLCIVLPWAVLLDLFAGSLSFLAPGLIGQPSGTLVSLWWRLAVDAGALTLALEGIGLLARGLSAIGKDGA